MTTKHVSSEWKKIQKQKFSGKISFLLSRQVVLKEIQFRNDFIKDDNKAKLKLNLLNENHHQLCFD